MFLPLRLTYEILFRQACGSAAKAKLPERDLAEAPQRQIHFEGSLRQRRKRAFVFRGACGAADCLLWFHFLLAAAPQGQML